MKIINIYYLRSLVIIFSLTLLFARSSGQSTMPDELLKNKINDQLTYIQGRTRIYDGYRAIREDMFQKLLVNISDTISTAFHRINMLNSNVAELNHRIDSLIASLESTKTDLETAVKTKNSFRFLGTEINKLTYNTVMWLIIIGLAVVLGIVFMTFRRSISVSHTTEKELKQLRNEFEAYRKSAREAREKLSMDHFNELKRLRGG
jgi:hypothetical protein